MGNAKYKETIEYECCCCGAKADVPIGQHKNDSIYHECECCEQMLPANEKDYDTYNIRTPKSK